MSPDEDDPRRAAAQEAGAGGSGAGEEGAAGHRVVCHLDRLVAERGTTLTALAEQVGVTVVNLSVLKNDRARAVRFSTLTAICDALVCQPGDLFSVSPQEPDAGRTTAPSRRTS